MNLKLEDVLWLLEVEELPVRPEDIPRVIRWTEELAERDGLKWIHEHRHRFVLELEEI